MKNSGPKPTPAASTEILEVSGLLKNPSRGPDVGVLQRALIDKKYLKPGDDDEIFLIETEDAVKAFQQDQGLVVDGEAGIKTLSALGIKIKRPESAPNVTSAAKGTTSWYSDMYAMATIDPGCEAAVAGAAKRCMASRARYANVSKSFPGMPWYFIACIHNMEASGNFSGVLHNGEKILGTGKKTSIEPKGRGPFATWEASAFDVLTWKGFDKVTDYSIGNMLRKAELYNGTGYLTGAGKAENSPYVWSMSSVNDGFGKYVADSKYDGSAPANGQVGFAILLKEILKNLEVPAETSPVPQPAGGELYDKIIAQNPGIEPRMVAAALKHRDNATIVNKKYILMENYSLPDSADRFWMIDTSTGEHFVNSKVAHGKGSDTNKDNIADSFSNVKGSFKTSLGAMLVGKEFTNPKWKHVRFLYGLEKGLNDRVAEREILLHTTKYVVDSNNNPSGDTLGCIGLSEETGDKIFSLVEGCLNYAWADVLIA